MIKFHGVDLTDIAPVKIEDVVVSPIALTPVARERPIAYGSEFIRMSGGERTVTVTFALLEMDYATRETAMGAIREWAQAETEQTLELPQYENRHLECICTQMPDYSYRKWWENKLRLIWTCFSNPYWTSNDVIEVPCGQTFAVSGSAPPIVNIVRNGGAIVDQTYATATEAMTFSRIPAGNLVIDLNRQTAAIGNTSIMQFYSPTSTWIKPKVGANQYINGVGTVRYRERWV